MLKHNLKIAFRSLFKNKVFSGINIFGLAIGLACSIIIMLWVKDELGFDKFHKNHKNIYRIIADNSTIHSPMPLTSVINREIPEIENAVRLLNIPGFKLEASNALYNENPFFVENCFFETFSFKFIEGNPQNVLSKPASIVISEDLSKRMFGIRNSIGQDIKIFFMGFEFKLTVSGIIENIPSNSHIEGECFISLTDFWKQFINEDSPEWGDWNSTIYIQTNPGADIKALINKIDASVIDHSNNECDFRVGQLQALKDIHLHSAFENDYAKCSDVKYIYIFSFIALIIVLIACINYINLTTSLAISRAKEIGIKKAIGGTRLSLIKQFFVESLIIVLIASVFSIILLIYITPQFNYLTNKSIEFGFSGFSSSISIVGSILIIVLLSGLFPALYLSSMKTTEIIKSKIVKPNRKFSFRNVLPVIQLSFSIAIIVGTLTVRNQMAYLQNMNPGYDKEQIVSFDLLNGSEDNIKLLKSELNKNSNITYITSGSITGGINNTMRTTSILWNGKEDNENIWTAVHRVDYDFQKTYNTKMKEGRFFSKEFKTDVSSAYILNEAAVKKFNIDNPVGKPFSLWGIEGNIIGVIKDYHFETAHKLVSPVVLSMNTKKNFEKYESITLKVKPNNIQQTLGYIQNVIQTKNLEYKPQYQFADMFVDNLYKSEKRLSSVFSIAAVLAIFISCLGLLGSTIYSTNLRTKEIGIRKVNGAKIHEILLMLNSGYVKWVIIAFIIACPFAWYGMNKWLENFAYKTEIKWWIFAISGIVVLVIALLTTTWQCWQAARRNPVEALRYE